jgi:hypothetical protein
MIPLLADENFDGRVLKGLMHRCPELDLLRAQDTGLMETDDREILEWAAREGRILLTHDADTVIDFAYERVRKGLRMPGVLEVKTTVPLAQAIEEILIFAQCSREDEWEGQVRYIPL